MKQTAIDIFTEAVRAADPCDGITRAVSVDDNSLVIDGVSYTHDSYDRIIVVGAGKASARMGKALETILGDRIDGGWINTKYGHGEFLKKITVHECGHPVPDENGQKGAAEIIGLLERADARTLVIALISGGGSALSPAPVDGVTLREKQEVTRLLLNAGATIEELNAVRKHLSVLKGGGMARLASPARLHVLILSDVIGDRLDTIASGPAVADETTFGFCVGLCQHNGVLKLMPDSVRNRFNKGILGLIPETAKSGDSFLDFAVNTLVGNNHISVNAASEKARDLGYTVMVLTTVLEGEASQAGTFFASIASEIHATGNPASPPVCIIAGGETTVTVRGNGSGGRNQEMALAAVPRIAGMRDTVFLSGGTDGTDGPTDAAGGVVDGFTYQSGKLKHLDVYDFLARNDSYHYLKDVDGLLVTGPTGTNVMDIQVLLVGTPGRISE